MYPTVPVCCRFLCRINPFIPTGAQNSIIKDNTILLQYKNNVKFGRLFAKNGKLISEAKRMDISSIKQALTESENRPFILIMHKEGGLYPLRRK